MRTLFHSFLLLSLHPHGLVLLPPLHPLYLVLEEAEITQILVSSQNLYPLTGILGMLTGPMVVLYPRRYPKGMWLLEKVWK